MNNFIKLTLTAALTACTIPIFAQSVVEVHAPDNGGVITEPLSTATIISFKTDALEISNGGLTATSIAYADAEKITFKTGGTAVASIHANSSLRLRRNPVESLLEITGYDGKPAPLTVASLAGSSLISLKEWSGEDIDVSALTPGIYLLNIDNKTLKFIKK